MAERYRRRYISCDASCGGFDLTTAKMIIGRIRSAPEVVCFRGAGFSIDAFTWSFSATTDLESRAGRVMTESDIASSIWLASSFESGSTSCGTSVGDVACKPCGVRSVTSAMLDSGSLDAGDVESGVEPEDDERRVAKAVDGAVGGASAEDVVLGTIGT